jgi:hypothetical protein
MAHPLGDSTTGNISISVRRPVRLRGGSLLTIYFVLGDQPVPDKSDLYQ